MKQNLMIAAFICLAPAPLLALPAVGDLVGKNPTDATSALAAADCAVDKFEAEGGKIEAKCHDAAGQRWEVYINPNNGKVVQVKKDH